MPPLPRVASFMYKNIPWEVRMLVLDVLMLDVGDCLVFLVFQKPSNANYFAYKKKGYPELFW